MVVYKDVLGALKRAGYSSTRLREEQLLSQSTLQRIRHNEPINLTTLETVCRLTSLKMNDLVEFIME